MHDPGTVENAQSGADILLNLINNVRGALIRFVEEVESETSAHCHSADR